jgi:hypothetical protein
MKGDKPTGGDAPRGRRPSAVVPPFSDAAVLGVAGHLGR